MSRRIYAVLAAVTFILLLSLQPLSSLAAAGYTLTDLTRAAAHASGRTVLPAAEIHRLDFNADNSITLADVVRIARQCIATAGSPAAEDVTGSFDADGAAKAALPYIPDGIYAEILSCTSVPGTDDTVYEVQALSHGGIYTITVDLADGSVRHREMEREPDLSIAGQALSLSGAKEAVVQRVPGASSSDVVSARRTDVQGSSAFEVRIHTKTENIAATLMEDTGEIVRWSEDLMPDGPDAPPVLGTTPPSTVGLISEQDAVQIALALVPGAASSDVVSCDLNTNTLPAVYTTDIVYDGASYTFQIGAYDAVVLCEWMEREPHPNLTPSPLSEQTALQALLDRLPGTNVLYPSVYARETEFGEVFDVHVDLGSAATYDATFIAATGELIFWEVESAVSHAVPDPIREIAPPR